MSSIKKIISFVFLMTVLNLSVSAITYYSKAAGNLNAVGTWGINPDGSGANPPNFTTAGNTFIIVNNAAPTLSANWTVSGAGSIVQVGDGVQVISFSVPTPRTLTATINVMAASTLTAVSGSTISGTVGVANTAFLIIQSATNPTLGVLAAGSTVTYSRAAAQTIVNAAYDNLTLGGSGTKTLANVANSSVAKVLTIGAGFAFQINTNNAFTLTLNGTITGAGTMTGGANSNLTIGGTGVFGTITPTAAPLTLRTFIVNRASLGAITLGGNLTVSTTGTFTNGVLVLNGKTLILNGTLTFPAAAANGTFTGSAASNLSIGATTITNNLFFTAGSQTLNNFTLNSTGQTLTLGTNLTVSGAYTQTMGIVSLNGKTLSLTGTATFATIVANGTTTGSATSNLLISASTITNRIFFTVGAQTLNNFTLASPAAITLRLGTSLTVSGAFTHTSGIFRITGIVLTLSGTAVFPVAAANGSLRGSNTADLSVSATAISNTLFLTPGFLTLRNLTLNSPGQTLTLGTAVTIATTLTHTRGIISLNGQTLTLNGVITFPTSVANGSFTGSSTSNLTIGGAGAITNSLFMTQAGTAVFMNNITLNRNGQTLTIGNTLKLVGTLTPTSGTLASGGNLVLIATSPGVVAWIGTMGATGFVTGNVTVQSYAKGGNTGWTNLGSAGITGRTFSDWDDNITITCLACPDGYSVGGSNFGSIQLYSETVGGLFGNAARYTEIANISNAMTIGKGYWVYLGNATVNTTDIILDVTGPVNQGNFVMNLTETNIGGGTQATDHGYNLIANPYPSPINWTSLRNGNANVANAIYVYNPDIAGNASFVNGVSNPAVGAGGIGNLIPAGQGFYVKANAAAVTLTALETYKGASAQFLLRTNGQQ